MLGREGEQVGGLLGDHGERLAAAVADGGLDAREDGGVAGLAALHLGGELETVGRYDAVVFQGWKYGWAPPGTRAIFTLSGPRSEPEAPALSVFLAHPATRTTRVPSTSLPGVINGRRPRARHLRSNARHTAASPRASGRDTRTSANAPVIASIGSANAIGIGLNAVHRDRSHVP